MFHDDETPDDGAGETVFQLQQLREAIAKLEEAQVEAIAKLEASIAQGHAAIIRGLGELRTPITIAVYACLPSQSASGGAIGHRL